MKESLPVNQPAWQDETDHGHHSQNNKNNNQKYPKFFNKTDKDSNTPRSSVPTSGPK